MSKDPNVIVKSLGPREREVMVLLSEALDGNLMAQTRLRYEALSTSDFPAIFQKVTNAKLDQAYAEAPAPIWGKISQRYVNDTMRPEKFKSLDINLSPLPADGGGYDRYPTALPRVPELTPYPTIGFTAGERELMLGKYGARIHFSWESWINDEWGVIDRMPGELGVAAVRTEDLETFSKIFGPTGWNTDYITTGMHLTNNPTLSLQSLQAALEKAAATPDASEAAGYRLNTVDKWNLLVPSSLVPLANSILKATQIQITDANGTKYLTENTVSGQIAEVVGVPYVPILSAGSTYKTTMWALVPANGNGSNRPTFLTLFLRGHETPEFRIKNDQGYALGGGSLDAYAGSFDVDDIQVRTRHFTGAAVVDLTGVVVSNGTNAA